MTGNNYFCIFRLITGSNCFLYSTTTFTRSLATSLFGIGRCSFPTQSDPFNAVFSSPSASGEYFNLYVLPILLIFDLSASCKQITDGIKGIIRMSRYSSLMCPNSNPMPLGAGLNSPRVVRESLSPPLCHLYDAVLWLV